VIPDDQGELFDSASCVEVARLSGGPSGEIGVRDSKHPAAGHLDR
jgi:Domain of unknown function (DUF397)